MSEDKVTAPVVQPIQVLPVPPTPALAPPTAVVAKAKTDPVEIVGGPGPFAIYGTGFGDGGTLTVGGVVIKTSRWADYNIKGVLPEGAKGPIVLTTPSGVRHGTYPTHSKAAAPTK